MLDCTTINITTSKFDIVVQNVDNILNEPKTGTFRLRINPEYKAEVEKLFSECGMTLSEAINIFLQMSLRVGGLPF